MPCYSRTWPPPCCTASQVPTTDHTPPLPPQASWQQCSYPWVLTPGWSTASGYQAPPTSATSATSATTLNIAASTPATPERSWPPAWTPVSGPGGRARVGGRLVFSQAIKVLPLHMLLPALVTPCPPHPSTGRAVPG